VPEEDELIAAIDRSATRPGFAVLNRHPEHSAPAGPVIDAAGAAAVET
jgi:hypothetical protein